MRELKLNKIIFNEESQPIKELSVSSFYYKAMGMGAIYKQVLPTIGWNYRTSSELLSCIIMINDDKEIRNENI